ncbi:hypothetical protein EV668_1847 [Enterovirga rhinocerotis]|uniref:Uncharacterized protein n=1 Tax=Enterovirga rhinocerotis TaxID=1339210 RepID=A0A4V6PZN7_9HYPH|nr:hypothetical protein EV668_1847 [Enterovirga rhinocerotis]
MGAGAIGSVAHQSYLSSTHRRTAPGVLPPIPVFDLRKSDPAAHAVDGKERTLALADACLGPLTPAARLAVSGADALARRWLLASGTPYADEIARIAAGTGVDGAHLLNASYEWGCTALAAPAPDGESARLLRTLDWPFHGLGQRVELWRQRGPAGEFAHLSWPGAVGLLTGMAPARFAAAINQPPLRRRAPIDAIAIDAAIATLSTWRSSGRIPALHLLRRVFETAPDFSAAREMLERTPIAAPAIFTLVGLAPGETCVIERDIEAFETRQGVASAANTWRYANFPGEWGTGRASEQAHDSDQRAEMIEGWAGRAGAPFEWVKAPILNGMTRLAVEADPAKGTLRALGYEEAPNDADSAVPATLPLDWSAAA